MPLGAAKAALLGAAGTVAEAGDFQWIAGTTFDGSTATHTFSGIPQTYNSLKLLMYFKGDSSPFRPYIRLNGVTTSDYWIVNTGSYGGTSGFHGSEVASATSITTPFTPEANVDMYAEAYVGAYTSSTVVSPVLLQWGSCDSNTGQMPFNTCAGTLRSGTAAITSVTVLCGSGNDAASGSTIQLFGYKDAA